jgi:hypothetical protein
LLCPTVIRRPAPQPGRPASSQLVSVVTTHRQPAMIQPYVAGRRRAALTHEMLASPLTKPKTRHQQIFCRAATFPAKTRELATAASPGLSVGWLGSPLTRYLRRYKPLVPKTHLRLAVSPIDGEIRSTRLWRQ